MGKSGAGEADDVAGMEDGGDGCPTRERRR